MRQIKDMRQIVDAKVIGVGPAVGIRNDTVEIFSTVAIDALDLIEFRQQVLDSIISNSLFNDNISVDLKV